MVEEYGFKDSSREALGDAVRENEQRKLHLRPEVDEHHELKLHRVRP